ncbi:phage tail protein [Lactiplantibacillus plantarum]|uniref:phage tail protein n=1 Tax=Lactiplantibacillus plantarum TaxID=1590 RepID=UPI002B4C03CB|nr:phage tail protein [Lactiplantibacillus plantarum]WRM30704.1 phage tail protein [Lactiplantibacillus plantarum]
MIKFYDSGGTVHFGQATITRKTSVNGGLSLTGEVFAGGDVLNGLDYGWWLNFDNEKYVITYKKLSDDTNTVVFDAVQQFFWDFAKVALHAQYTGSHEYSFYLGQLFDKSGYTYKNDVAVPAFEKENWGYKNKLDLFNDIIDQADVEFEVHNETVHIAEQIGSDLTSFVRKGINLSDLTEEMKISDFATYARGYGAFKDDQDQSKGRLEVEYRSELAKQFGDLEMDPIVDKRYTIADNLIAALKKRVDATYTVSMTMNIYDLENAGYPNYEAPKVGDWILAIDEALNFKRKIRIIQLEEQFDVTGKRIGYTATCGDLSIVDQYTHLQISLDSKVQRIQETVDAAATSANGKNTNYYGAKEPVSANEGDLWFDQSNSDPDKWSIKQWVNGRWEQITLNPGEIDAKVDVAKKEAETAVENAKSASDKADQLASKYDDTNALAHQALDRSVSAQSDANSAVAAANSTASEFGKVSQKTDNAVAAALNAQNDASDAVKQASSAAADSKDAKQIAGAVSQSYKTLTDGSTMTIAELQNGLATKLTKTDLNGYATQTWTQNQIKMTADGINGTMSSIKSTVDGQTTSINDLKADSSSFKSQFTTVNNTLGKQTTDIGTLQATSKELTTGFNTLTTDNTTNKNDISQLKQTATELNSTMVTVQTQVQDSAVGTNLLLNTGDDNDAGHPVKMLTGDMSVAGFLSRTEEYSQVTAPPSSAPEMYYRFGGPVTNELHGLQPGQTYTIQGEVSVSKGSVRFRSQRMTTGGWADYDSGISNVLAKDTEDFVKVSYSFTVPSNATAIFVSWQVYGYDSTTILRFRKMKLEKGSVATDFSVNPEDTATVSAFSKLSQTVDGMQLDISKKIEQKDLNGYATQTWTQNQIKVTADGINSTLSSVKTTVDGHTTSINTLKADSSGFKAQFVTVNDTLGKQTKDIGTLQATNKSLVASYDSLNADNATNKHNISQLQLTANAFKSTLATVQQQVTDSSVGTNLLANTADNGVGVVSVQGDTSDIVHSGPITRNSSYLEMTSTGASELYYRFCNTNASMHNLKPGQTYTIQGEVYVNKGDVRFRSQFQSNGGWGDYSGSVSGNLASNTSGFTKVKYTFTIPANATAVYISWQVFNFDSSTVFRFRRMKLEIGGVATDYSTSPLDNATITALSSISQTVDAIQTTVRGKVDNDTYQSKMTQLDNQITTKVSQGDITNENILPYSGYWSDTTGWTLFPWGASDKTLTLIHHNFYHNAVDATLCIGTSQNATAPAGSSKFTLIPNTTYTFSFWGFASGNVVGTNVYLLGRSYTSTSDYDFVHPLFENLKMSPSGINKYTATFTTGATETQAYVRLDNGGSNNGQRSGSYFAELKLERGDTATPYTRVSSGEIQVTSDNINLKVSKDGVINAINVSPEGTTIYGNKLRITAATYIDNAVIKDAMIAGLNASKLTAGSIDAAKINVYNINGSKIVANSITADKLQAGSMLIAMNSTLQTLKVGTDGLYTTNNSGTFIGKIHANNLIEHPGDWGLHFDLSSNAQYMAWGAQNEGDPNGGYVVKFGWTRNSSAGDFTMPWGGFWFNDNVMLHKNLRFNGGGIDVDGAYQLMKFAWISMNGIKYPFFGSSNLKAGWLFGSSETYLVRDGGIINASKILGVLNGQHYKFIKDLNSNGTVKGYVDVKF